jgi:nifR3 family TIM-barrel protein
MSSDFLIKNIMIYGDVILAPMVSISDMPYRLITRKLGNALSWSAFVNAQEVIYGHPHRLKDRLQFIESERPFVMQLYGNDIDMMIAAAKTLMLRQPDILDINLGCSIKAISARGAGAGMLRDMPKVINLIQSLCNILPVPITTKIRLGWDELTKNPVDIAQTLQEAGSSMITVHARTRSQHFDDIADWEAIHQIKAAIDVPVIGNGDIKTPADIDRMKSTTGCDAVMIGRAAIGNPWLFSRRDVDTVPIQEKFDVIKEHLNLMCECYTEKRGVLLFRKHVAGYLSHLLISHNQRTEILKANTKESFLSLLKKAIF